jgi:hypothetical protein
MGRKATVLSAMLIASAGVTAALPAPTYADAPPTYTVPSPAQLAGLTPGELALFTSGAPQTILMDPTTGDILSVSAAGALPAISKHAECDPGNGCYKTNNGNYTDQGFYGGSGTIDGTWHDRSSYSSGNYTVSACWSGGCGVEIGPGSAVTFTSDVTGTSFTIH